MADFPDEPPATVAIAVSASHPPTTLAEINYQALVNGSKEDLRIHGVATLLKQKEDAEHAVTITNTELAATKQREHELDKQLALVKQDLSHHKRSTVTGEVLTYVATAIATVGGALLSTSGWFSTMIVAGVIILAAKSFSVSFRSSEKAT